MLRNKWASIREESMRVPVKEESMRVPVKDHVVKHTMH